jgi:serine/threonine protein kinase
MTEHDQSRLFRNRYQIVKKLGAGNFGTAYLVTDLNMKHEP